MRSSALGVVCALLVLGGAIARPSHHHHSKKHSAAAAGADAAPTPNFDEAPPLKLGQYELLNYNPVANANAVVVQGSARFTVLTDRIIRIEWDPNGVFEDRTTLAIVNRNLTVPNFTYYVSDGILTITTQVVQLTYHVGAEFSDSTLYIKPLTPQPQSGIANWYFSQSNSGTRNLLGTVKSLDMLDVIPLNCTENSNIIVHDEILHCEWGLMSRDGWALIDDHTNYALDSTYWWAGQNRDQTDLYYFGHGLNYKLALSEFVSIAGRIAMVPKSASGVWWSRWFNLDNSDLSQIVATYERLSLPLDVFILDMDWHTKYGWGGYSWDKRLFPSPSDTMAYLHSRGLITGANIHDDDGVRPDEDEHDAMARAMGLNPATCGTIPFSMINSSYVYALEDVVLKAVEDTGMDFWWIDWQQGGTQGGCTGDKQNPTIWTDRIRCTDHLRRGDSDKRGITLARWGGLGTHRYQVGFSGDVMNLDWADLAFQPYYSFTSSNVGYGFWSHDLVGPAFDHELHTRWIQWGAYSGIMRTHDRGMSSGTCAEVSPSVCAIVEIWKAPWQYFETMRSAFQTRAALLPHIYNAVREAYDSGVSILRPMYYEFPNSEMAYAADNSGVFPQYFFGSDSMFVSPVVRQAWSNVSMSYQPVWIPPGLWFEKDTQVLHNGGDPTSTTGVVLNKVYDLSEIPVFIAPGTIVAELPTPRASREWIGRGSAQYTHLAYTLYYSSTAVAQGQTSGNVKVYEDDGATTQYVSGSYGLATASWSARDANTIAINLAGTGGYPERPTMRQYEVRLVNTLPPTRVVVNGNTVPYARWAGQPNTYTYSAVDGMITIDAGSWPATNLVQVVINLLPPPSGSTSDQLLNGVAGVLKHAKLAKQNLDVSQSTPGCNSVSGGALDQLASAGDELSRLGGAVGPNQQQYLSLLANIPEMLNAAQMEISSVPGTSSQQLAYSQSLLSSIYN